MTASILTIGDELLIGQVVNTNAAWLGEQLSLLGADPGRVAVVGDDEAAICAELARACMASDLVVLTGGLGPTHDDVTVRAVAAFVGVPVRTDAATLEGLLDRYRRRGRPMPESNRKLAEVPEGFAVLPNPVGAAPGLWGAPATGAAACTVVVLPGVPSEMKALFREQVVPRLRQQAGLRVILHRTLLTAGVGESNLQEEIGDLTDWLGPDLRLAYLPGAGRVRLRLTVIGGARADAAARLDRLEAHLRDRIGRHVYGTGDDTLEGVVGGLLKTHGYTLATAESCTGGLVVHRLTNVSGSSAYVIGGVVAYANAVKVSRLGVDAAVLEREGAVSEAVAREMARGVREYLGADVGVSTTGIAGPTGGTPEKPVGTVWIGYADAHGDAAHRFHFGTDREMNKERFATAALDLVRRRLLRRAGLSEK